MMMILMKNFIVERAAFLMNGHIITKAGMKEERQVTYQLQLAEKDACGGQTANAMKLGTRVKYGGNTICKQMLQLFQTRNPQVQRL
jgi:hypothetical protein